MKINSSKNSNIKINPTTTSITLIITTILLSSCTAKAGYRHHHYEPVPARMTEYQYFPKANVYYDSYRRVYHYQHKQRGWLSVNKLPKHIHVDNHRRYSVHSNQQKPRKNKHLQKKHHSHTDNHFTRHAEKTRKRHHVKKSHPPRNTSFHQKQQNHGTAHHDGNRQHIKHRNEVSKQRKVHRRHSGKQNHVDVIPVNKAANRKGGRKQINADKKTARKTQDNQQHRTNTSRRANSKQDKNRVVRNDGHSRQKAKHRRN